MIKLDYYKLLNMVLIITYKHNVTISSLNKLLFFSDLLYFLNYDKSISGVNYYKEQFGTVPEKIDTIRYILIRNNILLETKYELPTYYKYSYRCTDETVRIDEVKKSFGKEELDMIEIVKGKLGHLTSTTLSEILQKYEPWKSADYLLNFEKAKTDKNLYKKIISNF